MVIVALDLQTTRVKSLRMNFALLWVFNQKGAEGMTVCSPNCAQKAKFFHEAWD